MRIVVHVTTKQVISRRGRNENDCRMYKNDKRTSKNEKRTCKAKMKNARAKRK